MAIASLFDIFCTFTLNVVLVRFDFGLVQNIVFNVLQNGVVFLGFSFNRISFIKHIINRSNINSCLKRVQFLSILPIYSEMEFSLEQFNSETFVKKEKSFIRKTESYTRAIVKYFF